MGLFAGKTKPSISIFLEADQLALCVIAPLTERTIAIARIDLPIHSAVKLKLAFDLELLLQVANLLLQGVILLLKLKNGLAKLHDFFLSLDGRTFLDEVNDFF